MQKFIVEYLRPWKLSTLAIGLGLLLIGIVLFAPKGVAALFGRRDG